MHLIEIKYIDVLRIFTVFDIHPNQRFRENDKIKVYKYREPGHAVDIYSVHLAHFEQFPNTRRNVDNASCVLNF